MTCGPRRRHRWRQTRYIIIFISSPEPLHKSYLPHYYNSPRLLTMTFIIPSVQDYKTEKFKLDQDVMMILHSIVIVSCIYMCVYI